MAAVALLLQQRMIEDDTRATFSADVCELTLEKNPLKLLRLMNPAMKGLLITDILIRFCEQIPYAFVVIWCMKTIAQPVSAFQFGLTDKSNIRMNPKLEPYGAIGDAGWYNMRAAVEYSSPGIEIKTVEAFLRRDPETNAAVSGSGIIVFDDGSTTTWNCGFESGAGIMDLRISGAKGVIKLDDFLSNRPSDQLPDFEYRQGWSDTKFIEVEADKPEATLMFEDFAAMIGNPQLLAASSHASERTQKWLDAVWNSAISNETSA